MTASSARLTFRIGQTIRKQCCYPDSRRFSLKLCLHQYPPSIKPTFWHTIDFRMLATSTSTTKPTTTTASNANDPTQAAIEKAEQLHSELVEVSPKSTAREFQRSIFLRFPCLLIQMISAQKAAQIREQQKPFGSSFITFLRSSKPQLFNIFFAFVCVLLAYQIHGLRSAIKRLLADGEDRESEIARLKGVLKTLSDFNDPLDNGEDNSSTSFPAELSRKCAATIQKHFQNETRPGYIWIVARNIASNDVHETTRMIDSLHSVILQEIRSAVGDSPWTDGERKERRVVELQEEVREATMGGLVEMLKQVHEERDDIGRGALEEGVVKRTRYAI